MSPYQAFGILILAAGNSSRLGEPKQLLQFQGKSLIRHVAEAATETISAPVAVVTGIHSELIDNELNGLPVLKVYNENWEEGMASSIRTGLSALVQSSPSMSGVILTVSDQPFINASLFRALIDKSRSSHREIVASAYDHTLGTPVFFSKKYFDALLMLKGAEGAKKLIKQFAEDVVSVPFPKGAVDIDTQEDYQKLVNHTDPTLPHA